MPALDTQDHDAVWAYVKGLPPLARGTAGGNTTCIQIQAGGKEIIIDAGSGLRELGMELIKGPCGRGEGILHFLFTHTHWDHVQGFPFFLPAFIPGNRFLIYSIHDVESALVDQQDYRFFPVPLSHLRATFEFIPIRLGEPFHIGKVQVNTIENAHPGRAYSYRLEHEHAIFVHASDSEYKQLDDSVQPHVEFFRNADALIFDAQYTLRESWQREDWGHSSALIGVDLARAAGVKQLILFHHDPTYSDSQLQEIQATALSYQEQDKSRPMCDVLIAYEGLTLDLAPPGQLDLQLAGDGETAILTPDRVFNTDDVEQLAHQLTRLEQSHFPLNSIIDLSQVETLTTAGLKSLVTLRQQRNDSPFVLVSPSPAVTEIIRLSGYLDYFAIYPSVDVALTAIQARETLNLPGHVINGRYQIEAKIFENRLAAVLKAMDKETGRTVVLKIFNPAFSVETIERLQRQTNQLIGVEHPHIVKVLTWEHDKNHTFLVEEFVTGRILHRWLAEQEGPLPSDLAAQVTQSVLFALEYAHSRGVIHSGLMPQNIFLTDKGVKLSGFGLGLIEARRHLLDTPLLVLNAAYAAPEQIMNQPADARTDLYALGVILYQMYTGRLPFEGHDDAVMHGHLHLAPRPPRELNPEISLSLEHLILKLLDKNPNNRYASARQALDIWTSLNASAEPTGRQHRAPLIGRDSQLQTLLTCWNEARAGRGQLAFIIGEPGIGKTSLAQELAVQCRPPVVLFGRCQEGEVATYHLFADVLRAYFTTVPPELFHENARQLLVNLVSLVPEIRQALPNLPHPAPLEPEEEQLRLMVSLTQFMKQATQERPWLMILDDLHWADQASLELLRYLGRHLPSMALLIIGTYRSTELERGHPLLETLRSLGSHPTYRHLSLERLEQEEVGRLLTHIWQRPVPAALTEKIYQHTEGNPFYVEEVARELIEAGLITFQNGRLHIPSLEQLTLPSSVHEVVWRRISHLHTDTQALLHQAAVLGQSFKFVHLLAMSGLPERELLEHLDMALERQLVQEVAGDTALSFRHAEIQRVLYADLGPLRRRILHRLAGEAMEHHPIPGQSYAAAEMAYHFGEAGELEKALTYSLEAARQAQAAYANGEALTWYGRTLEILTQLDQPDQAPLQLAAHQSIGDVLGLVGRYDEALGHYAAARALLERKAPLSAEDSLALADLCRQTGEIYEKHNEYEQALQWLEKGLAYLNENEPTTSLIRLYNAQGWIYMRQGRYELAQAPLKKALTLAPFLNLPQLEASSLRHLGTACWYLGEFDTARAHWEQSLHIYRRLNDRHGESKALNNLSLVAIDQGDYIAAREYSAQALLIFQEVGHRWAECMALNNLGHLYRRLGDYDRSKVLLEQALRICREIGDRQTESMILSNLGFLFHYKGDEEAADAYSQKALFITRHLGARRDLADALTCRAHALSALGHLEEAADAYQQAFWLRNELGQTNLALDAQAGMTRILLAQGDLPQALAEVEEIMARLKEHAAVGNDDPFWVYLTCYDVLQAAGDGRAEAVLRDAYYLLQERALRIKDEQLQRSYLERVPTHRQIITLWQG